MLITNIYVNLKKFAKKINYFSSIYTSWIITEFLRWFTETDARHFKSGTLQTITNITRIIVNWKKEFLHWCISKILFIDTKKLSKMQISLQVFFKDFADRFRINYLKNGFFWSYFSRILLIDFRIATNLKLDCLKSVLERFWS